MPDAPPSPDRSDDEFREALAKSYADEHDEQHPGFDPPELVDLSRTGILGGGVFAVDRAEVAYAGYVWIAYSSRLPKHADGGAPDTHRLVTLLTLNGTAAHVMATDGYLHPSYLDEKFGHVVPDQYAPGAWAAIGAVLGREVG